MLIETRKKAWLLHFKVSKKGRLSLKKVNFCGIGIQIDSKNNATNSKSLLPHGLAFFFNHPWPYPNPVLIPYLLLLVALTSYDPTVNPNCIFFHSPWADFAVNEFHYPKKNLYARTAQVFFGVNFG